MQRHRTQHLILILAIAITAGCSGCSGDKKGGKSGGKRGPKPVTGDEIAKAEKIENSVDRCKKLVSLAKRCVETDDTLGAKTCLKSANKAARKISIKLNPNERADAFVQVSKYLYKNRELEKYRDAIKEAVKAIDKIEQPAVKSKVLYDLARARIDADEKEKAVKDLVAAEAETEKVADGQERVRLLARYICYAYFVKLDDKAEAKRVIDVALKVANEAPTPDEQARMLAIVAGRQYKTMKDTEAAQATMDEALKLARSIGGVNLKANVLIDIAEVYRGAGWDRSQVNKLLNEAEEMCRGKSECEPALRRIEDMRS